MEAIRQTVKFTLGDAECAGTLVSKKGLFWEVETEPGIVKKVPVKAVLNRADFEEQPRQGPANPNTLAAQLAGIEKAAAAPKSTKAKKEKVAKDPDLIELAALCTECKIQGRIARRRLRKVMGTLPEGARWEWKKDDPKLAEVRALLLAKEDPAAAPAPAVTPEEGSAAVAALLG